ncbi:MAG: sigma-54-dependent Fis family transcriptional regulator [Actinobacteria bacterium]|nr:MAG: sigma-54-dependent Fis family transcriptional regulator [Actinomycetota bacterium]
MRMVLNRALSGEGYEVSEAASGKEALEKLTDVMPDLVVMDQKMPEMDGLTALKRIKKLMPALPIVMLTAHGNVESAVDAIKAGATEYLTKPFDLDELKLTISKALGVRDLFREVDTLRAQIRKEYDVRQIVGASEQMADLYDVVKRVAKTNATVMVYGESGTGKELIARAVHESSNRSSKPFVQVSCAALPETLLESELFGYEKGAFTGAATAKKGRFELADGGTLFLDEIGDISPSIQVKLLRVLQEKTFEHLGGTKTIKVDVRIVGATNKDLQEAIADGNFREDLYYRLNVVPITVPPLRDRKEDIPLLVAHFLEKFGSKRKVSTEAMELLINYDWPGNIRELENTIERAIILGTGEVITPEQLPSELKEGERREALPRSLELPPEGVVLEDLERDLVKQALRRSGNNQGKAAKLLGISRHELLYRMERYGLH